MKLAVIGAGVRFLPERFARILQQNGVDAEYYPFDKGKGYNYINWRDIDVLWNIGFFFEIDCLFDYLKSRFPHLKIINTWVGTDLINTYSFIRARPKCRSCLLRSIDIHVVDDPSFIRELRDGLGVDKAWFVPSVPEPMPLTPLPNEFAVGTYIPPHRKEFYGFAIIMEAAKELPNVPFYVFALSNLDRDKTKPPLPNIHFVGFVQGEEKLEWWSKCSSFISIPVHGGVGLTLVEYAMMGRRVITNKKIPHAYYVEEPVKPEAIVEKIKEIMELKEPDREASEYYHKEYGYDKVIEHVKPILENL